MTPRKIGESEERGGKKPLDRKGMNEGEEMARKEI